MFLGMRLGHCTVVVLVAALACYLVRSSSLLLGTQLLPVTRSAVSIFDSLLHGVVGGQGGGGEGGRVCMP